MALLELSQYNRSRIAVMLGVPPWLVALPGGGDPMTYANASGYLDFHWRAHLRPRAKRIMADLAGWALRGVGVEVDSDEYVQPGPKERAETYQILAGIQDASGRSDRRRDPRGGEIRMSATLIEAPTDIEVRSGQVAEVNFPKRTLTCIAMPYERPTVIPYGSKQVTEVVSRTAFSGIEKRTSQVRVNRDHSWDKPVGKVVGLHPSRKEGLVTEVRIAKTTLGDETLELCDEDILGASVGFGLLRRDGNSGPVYDDAEIWEQEPPGAAAEPVVAGSSRPRSEPCLHRRNGPERPPRRHPGRSGNNPEPRLARPPSSTRRERRAEPPLGLKVLLSRRPSLVTGV